MIKVCHLSTAHPWNDVRIFGKECRSLASHGFEVYLVAFEAKNEIVDGVHIVNAGKRPPGRIKRMWFGPKIIYKIAKDINADIYHFHDPELIPTGIKLSKKGKNAIYDIHEDVPAQILDKPYLNKTLAKCISFLMKIYENYAIRYFKGLICATPYIKDSFAKKHPNVTDINNFPVFDEICTDMSKNIKEKKVCYIGNISEIRGIIQMIDALAYCSEIRLDIAGEFDDDNLLQKVKKSKAWSFVNQLGHISRNESLKVKNSSLAGLVTFLPTANHINAQPNKLFEYMSAGIPVICSHFPLWREIVEQNNCGICVDPQNPKEIASAINFILNNPEKAALMGENGRKAVLEKFNWTFEEKKLVDFYNKLSQSTI